MPTIVVYSQPGNVSGQAWDGHARRDNVNQSWTVIHTTSSGTDANASGTSTYLATVGCATTSDNYRILVRGIVGMQTSLLDTSWNLNSATLYLKGSGKWNQFTNSVSTALSLHVVRMVNPGNIITTGSYNYTRYSTVSLASISYSAFSATGWNSFAIPVDQVNKGANTYYGVRTDYDRTATAPAWENNKEAGVSIYFADQAGTSDDPYMVVVYNAQVGVRAHAVFL